MAKVFDCGHDVNEFELESRCYVHFHTNSLSKGMNVLIHTQIISLLFFCKYSFWFYIAHKGWCAIKQRK